MHMMAHAILRFSHIFPVLLGTHLHVGQVKHTSWSSQYEDMT